MSTTPRIFANALLAALNAPVDSNNVQSLIAFQAQEGGFMHNTAAYNPLNTTYVLNSKLAPGFSSPSIQAYPDWATGLKATVKTLQNGLYSGILAALQESASPDVTLQAVKNSPFGWYYCIDPVTSSSEACSKPGAVRGGPIEPKPAASLQYEADVPFPPGPNPLSTLGSQGALNPFLSAKAPSFGPSVAQAGVGAVLAFGFWKLYEFLGKH